MQFIFVFITSIGVRKEAQPSTWLRFRFLSLGIHYEPSRIVQTIMVWVSKLIQNWILIHCSCHHSSSPGKLPKVLLMGNWRHYVLWSTPQRRSNMIHSHSTRKSDKILCPDHEGLWMTSLNMDFDSHAAQVVQGCHRNGLCDWVLTSFCLVRIPYTSDASKLESSCKTWFGV